MMFHVKGNPTSNNKSKIKQQEVEPILFLSKVINARKSEYWLTELEMAGLV